MTAASVVLALLVAAAAPGRLDRDAAVYDQAILDELQAMAPAAVEDGRAAAEAYRAGRWQEAIDRYERVYRAAPRFSHALRRQCAARVALEQHDAALALCRRAMESSPIPENGIALARALVARGGGSPPTPAARQEAVRLASSALEKRPEDATLAGGACDVATSVWDVPLLQTCSARMARLAPDETSTHLFQSLADLAGGRLREARVHLATARAGGLDPRLASAIAKTIDGAEPPLERYGPAALAVASIWAAGLLGLVGLGMALSATTMRAAGRMARSPRGEGSRVSGLLRRLYGSVLWVSCAYYYFSIPLVLLAVVALGGGVFYAFMALGRIPVKLVLVLGLVVLVTAWAVLKSLWVSVFRPAGGGDPGFRIDGTAHPRLARMLAGVADRIGTRPVDAVFLTPGTEVAVFERGGMLKQLSGRSERCLILGVGVLDGMRQGELKAVLAHEYGHLVNRDTAGGGFALAVRRSLLQMARTLAGGGAATWYNPAWWFVKGFHRAFLRVSQGASRLQEILADRWAALAYGGRNFARGLQHVIERGIRFDAHAERALREVIEGSRGLVNLYQYAPANPVDDKEVGSALEQALAAEPSPYDSHPRPKDRIAWVGDLVADGPADPDDDGPAWEVFEDRDAVERQMTDQIRISVAANHGIQIPVEAPVDPVP